MKYMFLFVLIGVAVSFVLGWRRGYVIADRKSAEAHFVFINLAYEHPELYESEAFFLLDEIVNKKGRMCNQRCYEQADFLLSKYYKDYEGGESAKTER